MITLTNVGAAYDTIQAARGLGVQRIDFRGATQITFDVYHQKVGTGTISYQLFNETDGVAFSPDIVVNDAAAAAVRFMTGTFSVAVNGVKLCRVRAKSTIAADDPIFFGASVSLNIP